MSNYYRKILFFYFILLTIRIFFLFPEIAMEALEDFTYLDDETVTAYKAELAIVSAPTILLTLEAGVGNKTLPMLLLHVDFQSNINDWSTKTVSLFIDMKQNC